jgi:hypothetical protein
MVSKSVINEYYRIQTARIGRCLYPFSDCRSSPIKAHSIQNSTALELLQDENHVMCIGTWFGKDGEPRLEYRSIGRNEASTFLGLCSTHDFELFKAIDQGLDLSNSEHLFLLAYRSLLREVHASTTAFIKSQTLYQERVKNGLIPGEVESIENIPFEAVIKAYGIHLFKETVDLEFSQQNFSAMRHIVCEFDTQTPTISCNHMFVPDALGETDEAMHLTVNVIPLTAQRTIVVFSCMAPEYDYLRQHLSRCLTGDIFSRKYEISKLLLMKCENICISPKYFKSWSDKKKQSILKFYGENIGKELDADSSEYFLF